MNKSSRAKEQEYRINNGETLKSIKKVLLIHI